MSDATHTVSTATVGRTLKRSLFWVGASVFVVVIAIVALTATAGSTGGTPFSSTNAAPGGAMALAEVLADRGVDVTATASLDETSAAIDDPSETTVLVYDDGNYLNDEQLESLSSLAAHVVVVDPPFSQLAVLAPDLDDSGSVSDSMSAACDYSPASRADTVTGEATGYEVSGSIDADLCLESEDGVYSLVRLPTDTGVLSVLGASGALTNGEIAASGNAAFALGLLGEYDSLVWYLPTVDDLPDAAATPGELTPDWVNRVIVILVLTTIAAAVWRGRRFGPLVVENLPVTVRASETMQGRARLYERFSARLRALDALRIGSISRLGRECGLPTIATVDDVVNAVAGVTGRQHGDIRALLVDDIPSTDAELIRLSDDLLTLERAVAAAVRP